MDVSSFTESSLYPPILLIFSTVQRRRRGLVNISRMARSYARHCNSAGRVIIVRHYFQKANLYALNEACVERESALHLSLNLIGILNFLEFGILSSFLTIIFYWFTILYSEFFLFVITHCFKYRFARKETFSLPISKEY